ncbi:GNAT family N-acetyltransferase [Actinospica durhamensis]|uniref:GNAT family N-acetyltransferase n=1 Tax=Actinospica durhamensis TaxID=1508375 RepID=A0A941IRW2_9ACTN|nr:GNAT family N-acetyltransferase [Actinospica durhamensis]MBR7832661.1 GNAT family N-acetyltransferase [Actinospica durhamensis]
MSTEVRPVRTENEFDRWSDALDIGFHVPQNRGDGRRRRPRHPDLDRVWAAFDGERVVGTFVSLPMELTLPGLRRIPLDGVSAVSVAATHRRQGVLSRMMAGEMAAARERGECVAALIAAEYPIYGRYGFGPATESAQWRADARDLRFRRELPGRIELVDADTALAEAPVLYDRIRAEQPGAVSRDYWRWAQDTGHDLREGATAPQDVLHALCRDAAGEIVGYARYRFAERWVNQRPNNTIHALNLMATDALYEARLWKYLADHDWVTEVVGPEIDRFDPLWRDLLADRRMAVAGEVWDFLWLRPLDPAAFLSARTYAKADRIVLRVQDKDGYATGTYAVESAADGSGECVRVQDLPDLTVPVDVLGSISLGGYSASRYLALGLAEEHTPGAADRLSTMLSTPLPPHNPMIF